MEQIKLQFNVDEGFLTGIARLQPLLGFQQGEGVTVTAEQGNKLGVSKTGDKAVIYYTQKHHFFRELGVLVEELKKGEKEFSIVEDGQFETVATMIDTSRCAVPTVQAFERLADRLALMGYNMIMVYIEDLMKLESRPVPGRNWEYLFFVDFTGDLTQPGMDEVLRELSQSAEGFRVLGNYKASEDT